MAGSEEPLRAGRPLLAAAALAGTLLLAPLPSEAQPYRAAGAPGPWSDFTSLTIRATDRAATGARAEWSFERLGPAGDLSISGWTSEKSKAARVEMLLVNERAWLVRGAALPLGGEIELLDSGALSLQLALRLLELARPSGPASLGRGVTVERTIVPDRVRVTTPSTSGEFLPPSTLSGTLKPSGPDGVGYRLEFEHGAGATRQAATLTGTWVRLAKPRTLDDGVDVTAFSLYELGPRPVPSGIVTLLGYGATGRPSAASIGEVRRRYPSLP